MLVIIHCSGQFKGNILVLEAELEPLRVVLLLPLAVGEEEAEVEVPLEVEDSEVEEAVEEEPVEEPVEVPEVEVPEVEDPEVEDPEAEEALVEEAVTVEATAVAPETWNC